MINKIGGDNKPVYAGAAAGTAIGAGTGLAVGLKKAADITANFKVDGKLTKDAYVNSRLEANMENVHNTLKKSKWIDTFKKISQKAGQDFDKAMVKAKNTKGKWALGVAAAGLAIGTAIGLIAKKNNEETTKYAAPMEAGLTKSIPMEY